jgi:outer membrane protein OmpA-like peptidoglycan-associated protein
MAAHRHHIILLFFLFALVAEALAQKYADPDSASTNGAAREALKRAQITEIVAATKEIQGASGGIESASAGIQSLLLDLGAKVTEHRVTIDLDADVLFDFDKYTLRPAAGDTLRKLGQVAATYPKSPLLIEGHTDSKGGHAYNITLSENRAGAVKKWLIQNASVGANRITTHGWGETKPVAPNKNPDGSDNPQGRQKNRRVEIVLTQVGS